ncbi:hypothetical protein H310_08262 [Aphanomyces invadans]|uniref:Uncharacterized protein n=1 Tax=Aphanomyces invadans TaxID=157072 RepID=A0A024U125_9STRA|nr:hypothetical protein H310_08262 [Aphanomyces invadans]ETV99611.1 hypothetical protein H310_08262 [Aphanomyces invadans]|eukprot:XP_008872167.1 hypothetical protein H310_08262 [Aphanomyces invadans]
MMFKSCQIQVEDIFLCGFDGTKRLMLKKTAKCTILSMKHRSHALLCGFIDEYTAKLRSICVNLSSSAFVFPNIIMQQNGAPKIEWYHGLEQTNLRKWLTELVQATPDLPIGITLHSLRRGGSFFRVFESRERRFNFRELMAW